MGVPRNSIKALMQAAAALALAAPSLAVAADRDHPTVVELFQSQGCSSCPPANANAMALSDRPDVLVLSFGVTYWDQLGWKDTFASPQFTARQWDYAHSLRHADVGTPEVIVNGRADVVGIRPGEIEDLIQREDRGAGGPAIHTLNGQVVVGAGGAGPGARVFPVRYDPNIVQVPIKRGENGGKTLPHKNVVKELITLGSWKGAAQTYTLPAATQPGLQSAILVQVAAAGEILAARKL